MVAGGLMVGRANSSQYWESDEVEVVERAEVQAAYRLVSTSYASAAHFRFSLSRVFRDTDSALYWAFVKISDDSVSTMSSSSTVPSVNSLPQCAQLGLVFGQVSPCRVQSVSLRARINYQIQECNYGNDNTRDCCDSLLMGQEIQKRGEYSNSRNSKKDTGCVFGVAVPSAQNIEISRNPRYLKQIMPDLVPYAHGNHGATPSPILPKFYGTLFAMSRRFSR